MLFMTATPIFFFYACMHVCLHFNAFSALASVLRVSPSEPGIGLAASSRGQGHKGELLPRARADPRGLAGAGGLAGALERGGCLGVGVGAFPQRPRPQRRREARGPGEPQGAGAVGSIPPARGRGAPRLRRRAEPSKEPRGKGRGARHWRAWNVPKQPSLPPWCLKRRHREGRKPPESTGRSTRGLFPEGRAAGRGEPR